MEHPSMQNPIMLGLMLATGVSWTLAYLLIIIKGFSEKTYGMPFAALCLNFSWEFLFSFVFPFADSLFLPLNVTWCLLDAVMVFQLFKYGPREFPTIKAYHFYGLAALGLLCAFLGVWTFTLDLDDYHGTYSGFGAALLMSVSFIQMLIFRRSLRGQNIWIAIFKMLGSLSPSIGYYFYLPKFDGIYTLQFLYVFIFIFDMLYVGMIVHHRKADGRSVWSF